MADIVLVRPGFQRGTDSHWSESPPLGLGFIASVARENDLDVKVVDGKLLGHRSANETINKIRGFNPRFVGISAMTPEYPLARQIAQGLKSQLKQAIIILGGAHANALPEMILSEAAEFDYVYAGDGELLFDQGNLSALEYGDGVEKIQGLYSRFGIPIDKECRGPVFAFDLSRKIFPAWELFPRSKVYPVLTQRGCPFKCVFCSHNSAFKIRKRPIDHVIEEINWLSSEFRAEYIHFEDETFGLDHKRIERLLVWLTDFNRRAKISFKAQTRVDAVSEEILKLMKSAGFEFVEFGVESGDPEVIEHSGKNINLDRVRWAVSAAKKAGLKVWLKFIIGLPGESKRSIRNTINLAAGLNPDRISAAVIVAYPGSMIYKWAKSGEQGYSFITEDWGRFDKYISNSVELKGLSARSMRRYQIQMYLETYLRNLRIPELISLIGRHVRFTGPLLRGALKN